MSRRRALAACVVLAAFLVVPHTASAQAPHGPPAPADPNATPAPPTTGPTPDHQAPDHQAQAEKLFEEGKIAQGAGDWTAACALFEASSALHEVPSVLVKLARCKVREQRFAEAIRLHERALALGPWPELDRLIRAELFEVQKSAPSFRVTLVSPSTGVTLRKDGALLTTPAGGPVWLDVGVPAHLDARAEGYRARTYDLVAKAEGEALEVRIELTPEPRLVAAAGAARAPSTTPPPPYADIQAISGWTSLGAGGAALAAGTVFGVQFLVAKGELYDDCSGTLEDGRRVCPASTTLAQDDAIAARTRAQVLLSVGALVAVGGVALLVTQPERPRDRAAPIGVVRLAGPGLEGTF